MKIVVGLGNPGPKYETTRHNVGFLAADRLIERWKASGPVHKNQGEIYQASVGGESVILIKPETYMNLSGRAVAPLFNFYHCEPTDLVVIYDELDLQPGTLRIKAGGGSAGHNGIRSLDEHLGKDNTGYYRLRIGIGHPSRKVPPLKISPADYVLQQFADEELVEIDPVLDQIAEAVEMVLKGQAKEAMNRFHRVKVEDAP